MQYDLVWAYYIPSKSRKTCPTKWVFYTVNYRRFQRNSFKQDCVYNKTASYLGHGSAVTVFYLLVMKIKKKNL